VRLRDTPSTSETAIALIGRPEGFVCGRPDIDETTRRLCAYADVGNDCLYAPRIDTAEQVAAIVAGVPSKPVNVLIDALSVTVAEAAALGVRRISREGILARTAWTGFLQAAQEIADSGSFSRFEMLPNVDACSRAYRAATRLRRPPALARMVGTSATFPQPWLLSGVDRTATTVRAN
jgi:2-methylisocitrate lyase-like PEP mutase family enzyme